MLEQMGITLLVIFLMQRPGIDAYADRDLVGRDTVLAHSIAQAVGQFSEGPFFVARNVAALVNPRGLARFRQVLRCRRCRILRNRELRRQQSKGEDKRETPDGARKNSHGGDIGSLGVKGQ